MADTIAIAIRLGAFSPTCEHRVPAMPGALQPCIASFRAVGARELAGAQLREGEGGMSGEFGPVLRP